MFKKDNYAKERLEEFIFKENYLVPPLYYHNLGKVLRFDLESRSEKESEELIYSVFNDLFVDFSNMHVIFYAYGFPSSIHWQKGKTYFKPFSIEKRFKMKYISKTNEDQNDLKPYLVVGYTQKNYFKIKKYIADYLNSEQKMQMAFISLKKGAVLQFYDHRGFDLLSVDKDFLKRIYSKYEDFIIEYNREEIVKLLKEQ